MNIPRPYDANPLIIVGRQRTGTRYLTNALNSFEEITIQGEIPTTVMKAFERFVRSVEKYYENMPEASGRSQRGQEEKSRWERRRTELVFDFWSTCGQSGLLRHSEKCRYYGYKRPHHESYFGFYERVLHRRPPIYIYCVRNFPDNYLSTVSRWPAKKIDEIATAYITSLRKYAEMTGLAPGRVLLFNLDDNIVGGVEYLTQNILAPLGLEVSDEALRRLSGMGAANRTEADNKASRRRSLTDDEVAFIQSRPELASEFKKLCRLYTPPK